MKTFLVILVTTFLIGCGKDDNPIGNNPPVNNDTLLMTIDTVEIYCGSNGEGYTVAWYSTIDSFNCNIKVQFKTNWSDNASNTHITCEIDSNGFWSEAMIDSNGVTATKNETKTITLTTNGRYFHSINTAATGTIGVITYRYLYDVKVFKAN